MKTVAQAIYATLHAIYNLNAARHPQYELKINAWRRYLQILKDCLPSGSGFDEGTQIDEKFNSCNHQHGSEFFKLDTSFHHMNEQGSYDGWTVHRVIVRATFEGIYILVTGRDRDGIKDYIGDCMHHALTRPAPEFDFGKALKEEEDMKGYRPVIPNPGESMFEAACRHYGAVSKEATKWDTREGRNRPSPQRHGS